MKTRVITHAQVNEMLLFIEHEMYKLKHELRGCYHDKIVILIPNWIKPFFNMYLRSVYNFGQPYPFAVKIYGIRTQPNYNDEIVIFYEDYHLNPERFKPAIYTIKFEENGKG